MFCNKKRNRFNKRNFMNVQQESPDNRTIIQKLYDLIKLIPLDSYWKEEINNHIYYYWVYGYEISTDTFIYTKVYAISHPKLDENLDENRFVYEFRPNATLYNVGQRINITQQEFKSISEKIFEGFDLVNTILHKLIIPSDYLENKEKWDELILKYQDIIPILQKPIKFDELKIGDKYLYFPCSDKSVLRIGVICEKGTKKIIEVDENSPKIMNQDEYSDMFKKFDVKERQVTHSQYSEKFVNILYTCELKEKHGMFLVSPLENGILDYIRKDICFNR